MTVQQPAQICAHCDHWDARGTYKSYGMGVCHGLQSSPQIGIFTDAKNLEISTKSNFSCAAYQQR